MRIAPALLLFATVTPVAAQDDHSAHHAHSPAPSVSSNSPAPPVEHAADALYDPATMAKARDAMVRESGGMTYSQIMIDRAEYRVQRGRDVWHWEGEGWIGGDIDRLAFRTKGEGNVGGKLERAELHALYSHAIGPWFNVDAGIRQDFGSSPERTYAVAGVSGLAPYWFEVEGTVFLSNRGDLHVRFEGSYDQRLTQRLILQPAAELNFSAQDVPELGIGSGLSDIELGMRLRYEIARELAPYIGINWERRIGDSARFVRSAGNGASGTSLVVGVRVWF